MASSFEQQIQGNLTKSNDSNSPDIHEGVANNAFDTSFRSLDDCKDGIFQGNGGLKGPKSEQKELLLGCQKSVEANQNNVAIHQTIDEKVDSANVKGLNRKRSATPGQRPKKRTRICRSDDNFKPTPICVLKRPKTIVDHSYYDYSGYKEKCSDIIEYSSDTSEKKELSFGLKLHEILDKYSNYIHWQPHGRAFKISIPKRFEMKVCPKYFNHSRYSTFLRQLNNHGFKHITQGRDRNCYYHEAFLKGIPSVTKFMPPPSNRRRLTPDPVNEPDFYRISASFSLNGQNNFQGSHSTGDVYQSENIATKSRNTIANSIDNLQSTSSNSAHALSHVPVPSLSFGTTHVGSSNAIPQNLDPVASTMFVQAVINRNQQVEAARERIIENLRKEKAMSDLLNRIRQQDFMSTSLLGPSVNVDYNQALLEVLKSVSMENLLSDSSSSNLQSTALDTSTMLQALQSRALASINQNQDTIALQLLRQYQANNSNSRTLL